MRNADQFTVLLAIQIKIQIKVQVATHPAIVGPP